MTFWRLPLLKVAPRLLLPLMVALLPGCHRDMRDQPRYETLEASDFFANGQSARPQIAGTVARGDLDGDETVRTGRSGGQLVKQIPVPLTRQLLERGHERFDVFCAPCHGRTGTGDGMIVQRGFQRPPSFHSTRLRELPVGHYFDIATNGFGAMPRYGPQVAPHDRWAIVAYVRALQLSQHAKVDDVPQEVREQLEKEQP